MAVLHRVNCNRMASLMLTIVSFSRFILSLSDNESIGAIGDIVGRNAIFLLITWVIIFFCVLRGPQSIAKVSVNS